jgi:hypothetical protein
LGAPPGVEVGVEVVAAAEAGVAEAEAGVVVEEEAEVEEVFRFSKPQLEVTDRFTAMPPG